MAVLPENRQDVIVVAHGFQVHQQRGETKRAQRGGRQQRTFHAVGDASPQHRAWRIARHAVRFLVVAEFLVEEALDARGLLPSPEQRELLAGEFGQGRIGHAQPAIVPEPVLY
jgi:hypothetical protein